MAPKRWKVRRSAPQSDRYLFEIQAPRSGDESIVAGTPISHMDPHRYGCYYIGDGLP